MNALQGLRRLLRLLLKRNIFWPIVAHEIRVGLQLGVVLLDGFIGDDEGLIEFLLDLLDGVVVVRLAALLRVALTSTSVLKPLVVSSREKKSLLLEKDKA